MIQEQAARLLLAVLASAVAGGGDLLAQDGPQLGRAHRARLEAESPAPTGRGPALALDYVAEVDGELVVRLHSLDFDAVLAVEDAAGAVLAEDDDGGVETDALVALEVERGQALRILITAADTGASDGEFTLELEPGPVPERTGAERLDAGAEFRRAAAARALARGDAAGELLHRLRLGQILALRTELADARATLSGVVGAAAAAGRADVTARALALLGGVLLDAGAHVDARRTLEEALRRAENLADSLTASEARVGLGWIEIETGRDDRARAHLEPALPLLEASCLIALGTAELDLGAADAGADRIERGRRLARESGDRRTEGRALAELGALSVAEGQLVRGRDQLEGALAHARWSGDRRGEADALAGLIVCFRKLGATELALERGEQALALARSTGARTIEVEILGHLADTHRLASNYPRALELSRARVALSVELHSPRLEAWSRQGSGQVLIAMGFLDEGERELEPALDAARALGDVELEGQVLGSLGALRFYRGDFRAALEAYTAQLELHGQRGDRQEIGNALNGVAISRANLGEYAAAAELMEEVYEIRRDLGDVRGQAFALANRGDMLRRMSALLEAREAYSRCQTMCETYGLTGPRVRVLLGLGAIHHDLADYARSAELYGEARGLALAQGSIDAHAALQSLADVRLHLGDYGGAHEAVAQLLEGIAEGSEDIGVLHLRARIWLSQGDLERARAQCEELLERNERRGTLHAAGRTLTCLAAIARERGEFDAAVDYGRRRLALARENDYPPGEAWGLASLAASELARGDAAEAHRLALKAQELCERYGLRRVHAEVLFLLARTARQRADLAGMERAVHEAEQLLEGPDTHALEGADVASRRSSLFGWARLAEDLTALQLEQDEATARQRRRALEDGFVRAGQWKSRGLLEGIVEHRRGSRSKAALALRGERREVLALRDNLFRRASQLAVEEGDSAEIAALRAAAAAGEARARELAEELRAASPRDAAVDLPRGVGPEIVRSSVLDAGALLIEYAEGEEDLYAYVLSRSKMLHLRLGSRAEIDATVAAHLEQLRAPLTSTPAALAASGRRAYALLLAPVLAAAEGEFERLIVVPTAALAEVPFEALVLPGSSDASYASLEYVIDRTALVYGPSSPVLAELAAAPARDGDPRVLVLADPLYRGETTEAASQEGAKAELFAGLRGTPGSPPLGRLHKTRVEALALARMLLAFEAESADRPRKLLELSDRRSGSLSSSLFDLHLGAEASLTPLSGDLRRYSVLHFATHGSVDREVPRNTGLALTNTGERAGRLTIADVLELDLSAELVVLSACETASGELRDGLGIHSLARAFMYAGARGVVASLWLVEDSAAADTMVAFYEGLLRRGLTPDRALREAKLQLRRSTSVRGVAISGEPIDGETRPSSHPYYWAPFQYLGAVR